MHATDARVDLLRLARHGLEQRVRAQGVKVRAGEIERTVPRDARQIERGVETELAREGLEDAQLRLVRVAHAEVEQLVESAGTEERGVEQVWPIRRADHEDVAAAAAAPVPVPRRGGRGGDAVEFGEELRDDPVHDPARVAVRAALGRDRVQLVEKDDAGAGVARTLEHATDVRFGLSDVHVQQFGTFDGKEVQRARGRDRLCEQGLARARRSIKKDPCGARGREVSKPKIRAGASGRTGERTYRSVS